MNKRIIRGRHIGLALPVVAACAAAAWLAMAHWRDANAAEAPPSILEHDGSRIVVGADSPLRRTLQVQAVAEQDIEIPIELPAVVEADAARLIKVLPPAAGRIASLDKQLGDTVRRGDVLFRIDAPDLAQARSDEQKARAALELSRRALERQRALGESDIAAQREIEQARNDFEQARSEHERAQARLAQMGQGTAGGSALAVRSPISGHVVDLAAAAGAYWNDATAPLMTVADLSSVFVSVSVAERDLGTVFVGQAARISLDAYPGETLEGRVRYVGELLDLDTRRTKVRVQFDNRDARLKPGMYAKAVLRSKAHRGVLVPLPAVVQNGFYARIYVETQPWQFEPHVVRLGSRVGDRVEVLAGLTPGERIVVKDGVLLDD